MNNITSKLKSYSDSFTYFIRDTEVVSLKRSVILLLVRFDALFGYFFKPRGKQVH